LRALVGKAFPAWRKLVANRHRLVEDEVLHQLAAGCQEAGAHELALAARQGVVARRGRDDPSDHPFIATGGRQLAPGKDTAALRERLKGGKLTVRQLVAPERPADRPAGPARAAEVSRLRLYVPTNELSDRVGKDVKPLADYIKTLEKAAS